MPRVDDTLEFVLDVESDTDRAGSPYDTVVDRRYLRHTRLTVPDEALTELASGASGLEVASLCARVHR